MKTIFEEYGKVILVVIVVVAIFAVMFGGVKIMNVMGRAIDVESALSHSKSEEAVESITLRTKPTIAIADSATTHLYVDETFNPIASVSCTDANGVTVTVTVAEIVFIDAENGSRISVLGSYDVENDKLDISSVTDRTGTLAVTYKAVDSYNITIFKTISFVVDAVVS